MAKYSKQLALIGILEHTLKQVERRILKYATENREKYLGFAGFITPEYHNWEQVWDGVAFAITRLRGEYLMKLWSTEHWDYQLVWLNKHARRFSCGQLKYGLWWWLDLWFIGVWAFSHGQRLSRKKTYSRGTI